MTKEQDIFLKIIKDHIMKEKTEIPEDIDWDLLLKYAKDQELQGIVYYQCKNYLDSNPKLSPYSDILKSAFSTTIYIYAKYKYAIDEIKKAMQSNDISFFVVKGPEIASVYPFPALRTMGDIDIVLSEKARDKASTILLDMGYTMKKGAFEWLFYRQEICIELHNKLNYVNYPDYRTTFFQSCWDYCKKTDDGFTILNPCYHFVFLIEHLRRHFSTHGVGFRQFIDVALFSTIIKDSDWKWIKDSLAKLGILEFAKNVFYVCRLWWGIIPPNELYKEMNTEAFVEESTELIFKNGVFGFNNDQHWANALGKSLSRISAPRIMKPVIRCFIEVCKPYEIMSNYPYCAFLKGRKYLLPFAWVKRFIYLVRNEREESIKAILSMRDVEHISKQLELRKQWGL